VDVRFGGFSLSFLTGVLDGSELSGLQNGLNGFQRGVCVVWVGHFLVCQTLRPLKAGWTSGGAPQSSSTQNKFSSALWKSRWKSLAVLRFKVPICDAFVIKCTQLKQIGLMLPTGALQKAQDHQQSAV